MSGRGVRCVDYAGGRYSGLELAAFEGEYGVDVYYGRAEARDAMTVFHVSHETAGKLGWFFVGMWFRTQLRWAWLQLRPWRWPKRQW